MKVNPPLKMFLECQTTGVKSRALGFSNEKSAWALNTDGHWFSARSNRATRDSLPSVPGVAQVGNPAIPAEGVEGEPGYVAPVEQSVPYQAGAAPIEYIK